MKKPKSRFIEDYREDAVVDILSSSIGWQESTIYVPVMELLPLLDQDDNVVVSALPIETGK